MMRCFQRQVLVKSLPVLSIYREPRLRETDLNQVVRVVESVLPRYVNGNIGAKVTLSEKDLNILADTVLVYEALINLVKNAMDAMPDGGMFSLNTGLSNFKNPSIHGDNDDNYGLCAFISLADTGTGIDEAVKERIFEPFFTTKTGNNKGLGLPIACHIIKEHGGIMKVKSSPGQGTAINVYLPLVKSETVNMIPIPLPSPHLMTVM